MTADALTKCVLLCPESLSEALLGELAARSSGEAKGCLSATSLTRGRAGPVLESAPAATPQLGGALTEPNAVPLIVLSSARDPVEAINSLLRRAGQPVHCTWIPALRDLADALTQINPQLLVQVAGSAAELDGAVGRARPVRAPRCPVLLLAPQRR